MQTLMLPKLKSVGLHSRTTIPYEHRYMSPFLNTTADFDVRDAAWQSYPQRLRQSQLKGVLDMAFLQSIGPMRLLCGHTWNLSTFTSTQLVH